MKEAKTNKHVSVNVWDKSVGMNTFHCDYVKLMCVVWYNLIIEVKGEKKKLWIQSLTMFILPVANIHIQYMGQHLIHDVFAIWWKCYSVDFLKINREHSWRDTSETHHRCKTPEPQLNVCFVYFGIMKNENPLCIQW